MLKLNAGFSRKVGEANYGSRGASVNVEPEVESSLVSDGSALLDRVRRLFALARQAVDEELAKDAPPPSTNGQASASRTERPATGGQFRAIRAIAEQIGVDPQYAARGSTDEHLEQLSVQQASQLIDELKARQQAESHQPR